LEPSELKNLSPTELKELVELWERVELQRKRQWLERYSPYLKQKEFHAAGLQYRERMLIAANQVGKTLCAGAEWTMHLTGRYPDWWAGYRFNRPVTLLAGSETYALNKRGIQRILLGSPEDRSQWGTGAIPHECIKKWTLVQGVPDAVESVTVKHVSGENSILRLLSYDAGRTKWQADTVDGAWFDEEPPLDIYTEGMTRTNVTGGPLVLTFTPMLGASAVVRMFYPVEGERAPFRHVTSMSLEDADHYTPEQRARIIEQYPEHEREARAFGRPILGSGMVFPVTETAVRIEPLQLPQHWARLVGLDFGWDHPTAAAWLAWDRDTDTVYVYKTYRAAKTTIAVHTANIRSTASWIPVAWPHDGYQHDKQAGKSIRDLYKEAGLNMLPRHATFKDEDISSFSFEAGIADMLDRMQTGRFKVFSNCTEFFSEFRAYHRKDGKVVKEMDDTISAIRYGIMMLRHAKTVLEAAPQKARTGALVSFGVLDPTTGY
jgi:phage terminase large subunit-like protein